MMPEDVNEDENEAEMNVAIVHHKQTKLKKIIIVVEEQI